MEPRVLTTGAGGYTGSIVCEHLLDPVYEGVALDNLMYGHINAFHLGADPRFKFVLGGARDEGLMRELISQADVIIKEPVTKAQHRQPQIAPTT